MRWYPVDARRRVLASEQISCTSSRASTSCRRPQRPRPSSYSRTGVQDRQYPSKLEIQHKRERPEAQGVYGSISRSHLYFPTRPPGWLFWRTAAPRACHGMRCWRRRWRRAHAMACAAGSGGGRSAASPGQTGLGAQQQQARAHVRAAGAGVREVSWARNGHGVETLCASPDPPPTLAAAGCRGLWECRHSPNHS